VFLDRFDGHEQLLRDLAVGASPRQLMDGEIIRGGRSASRATSQYSAFRSRSSSPPRGQHPQALAFGPPRRLQ
jgi:hypothetical protein